MISRITIAIIAATLSLHAAPRPWKSADGQRTVDGEFVKRDATSVTVRRSDRTEVTITLEQLDANDRTWLDVNHPLPGKKAPPTSGVFDQLNFGDNREQVLAKLKASKFVELTVQETFIGRTGLNGVFRTRKKIDGFDALLFFDWTDEGGLKEITLQTTPLSGIDIEARLTPCWREFIELLTSLYGQPLHANATLGITSVRDGGLNATHLWKLEQGGSAMLGASREGDDYHIAVRFTTKDIKPVVISGP